MKYDSIEYKQICEKLGFNAHMQYVRVTRSGSVEPTAGTRQEAVDLWKASLREKIQPSKKFIKLAKRENFYYPGDKERLSALRRAAGRKGGKSTSEAKKPPVAPMAY